MPCQETCAEPRALDKRLSWISRRDHSRRLRGTSRNGLSGAEGVGFEPTVPQGHNGFRDRPIRPLSHPSVAKTSRLTYCQR